MGAARAVLAARTRAALLLLALALVATGGYTRAPRRTGLECRTRGRRPMPLSSAPAGTHAQKIPPADKCLAEFNSLGGESALLGRLLPCQSVGPTSPQCCSAVRLWVIPGDSRWKAALERRQTSILPACRRSKAWQASRAARHWPAVSTLLLAVAALTKACGWPEQVLPSCAARLCLPICARSAPRCPAGLCQQAALEETIKLATSNPLAAAAGVSKDVIVRT